MTILITGATGTIGSQVASELLDRGASVRVASRRPEALARFAERGAEVTRIDLEDPASLAPALAGVTRAFVVGPQSGPDFGAHIELVVAAAAAAGVEHLLRYSALGADPEAPLALSREHGVAEAHVKAGPIPWTILEPTFYQDNIITFSGDSIRSEGVFYGAAGDGAATYVSSADIARVAAAILEDPAPHAGATYVLTGPEALSSAALAALATEVLGREIRYVDLPPETLGAGMRGAGLPGWLADALVGLEAVKRDGYAAAVSPAVREITGRDPESYRTFLERNRGKLA